MPHDDQHGREQDFAPLVVAHEQRLALLVEPFDVLVGERQFAAEEEDLPRGLQPDEEERQRGEAAVDGVVGGHPPLEVNVAPLEQEEDRARDDSGHQGAADADLRVGDHQIEQREHAPDDHHRRQMRQQAEVPAVVESQQPFGVVGHGVGHDPEHRDDHHHGDVVGPLARDAALDLHFPDVVEGALDRPEDADHGPEEHHEGHGGHHAALRAAEGVLGEIDDVAHDLGVLREERVEVLHQSVRQAEALDHGEHYGGDRHERHERIEGQRRAAHERPVLLQPPRRVEEQLVLLHEPPHDGVAPFAGVAPEDRVGEVCRNVADFHGNGVVTVEQR